MTEADARKQFRIALRACTAQAIAMFMTIYLVVLPLAEWWPRHTVTVVVGVVLLWTGWANSYTNRWMRHLQWCRRRSLAEEAGDTITMLGLIASPDADRPKMWPAFWFRLWGVKP